ncbi:MAG: DUF4129 domain-containing protein [Luteolibacter sp.]
MRLENVTAAIRPRSDWEAVDLGLAMARRDFWRCLAAWCLATGAPAALGIWLLWDHPLVLLCLFWWWRPAGSRMVLFELSRRLFGEAPRWREVFREIPRAWTHRFFHRFILLRLSPWLPVTLAVESLEGLRGTDYKQRATQISRRGESAVLLIYLMGELMVVWLGLGLFYLLLWFIPNGQDGAWQTAVESFDWNNPREIPLLVMRPIALCVMAAMILCDVFLTGAGFGIYINNRTWLEGWDVELAFRRMSRRLNGTGTLLLAIAATFAVCSPRAMAEDRPPAEIITEVKQAPEFEVHTITQKIPTGSKIKWPDWLKFSGDLTGVRGIFTALLYFALALLAGLIAWLVWRNRHLFVIRGGGAIPSEKARARVVMGMEVTRESLPDDIPATALRLWEAGRRHEAMALLYRGSIAALVDQHQLEIDESDTEGDCLRRAAVVAPGPRDFFQSLTHAWTAHAYAKQTPGDDAVRGWCASWPFVERRTAG